MSGGRWNGTNGGGEVDAGRELAPDKNYSSDTGGGGGLFSVSGGAATDRQSGLEGGGSGGGGGGGFFSSTGNASVAEYFSSLTTLASPTVASSPARVSSTAIAQRKRKSPALPPLPSKLLGRIQERRVTSKVSALMPQDMPTKRDATTRAASASSPQPKTDRKTVSLGQPSGLSPPIDYRFAQRLCARHENDAELAIALQAHFKNDIKQAGISMAMPPNDCESLLAQAQLPDWDEKKEFVKVLPARSRRDYTVKLMIEGNPEYDWGATLRSDILIEAVHFVTHVRPMSERGIALLWRRFLAPCFRFYMAHWAAAVSKRAAFMRTSQFTDNLRSWLRSMAPVHRAAWNAFYRTNHGPLRLKRVVAADTRQRGFTVEEEEAAEKYDYSSEEIEGDFDSEEEEGSGTKRPRKCKTQKKKKRRERNDRSGGTDVSPEEKAAAALLVKQYDFDALSREEVDALWRQATIITTLPKPESWIAHINSLHIPTAPMP